MYFVAIDLGATYIKSCLVDQKNFEISNIKREKFPSFDTDTNNPDYKTVSLSRIVEIVKNTLIQQVSTGGVCKGIFFSNQMHGFVLFKNTGAAVTPIISWQDKRVLKVKDSSNRIAFDILREKTKNFIWNHETGEHLRAGFPVTQLFAMSLSQMSLDGLIPLDLGNAVISKLSHVFDPKIDTTNASAMGCWSISEKNWHSDLLKNLNLDKLAWPQIVESGTQVSITSICGQKIPLHVSVGDQQVSLLGAGFNQNSQVSVNIATGSQVSVLSPDLCKSQFQVRPYFNGKYLNTITHIPAGRSLNALLRLFSELNTDFDIDKAWQRVDTLMGDARENGLTIDLAFFDSAFANQGSLNGIIEDNLNVGAIMRAAFEAIASSHLKAYKILSSNKDKYSEIIGSGGVFKKSKYLQTRISDTFGIKLKLSNGLEDALLGCAVLTRQRDSEVIKS